MSCRIAVSSLEIEILFCDVTMALIKFRRHPSYLHVSSFVEKLRRRSSLTFSNETRTNLVMTCCLSNLHSLLPFNNAKILRKFSSNCFDMSKEGEGEVGRPHEITLRRLRLIAPICASNDAEDWWCELNSTSSRGSQKHTHFKPRTLNLYFVKKYDFLRLLVWTKTNVKTCAHFSFFVLTDPWLNQGFLDAVIATQRDPENAHL